jgi:hypothetical protein
MHTLRDRIELLLVEELNKNSSLLKEPERYIPVFIQAVTQRLLEMMADELTYKGNLHSRYRQTFNK